MKKSIILIFFIQLFIVSQAQEKIQYEINDRIIEFTISHEEIYVEFDSEVKLLVKKYAKDEYNELTDGSAILKFDNSLPGFLEKQIGLISQFPFDFKRIEPVLVSKNGSQYISNGGLNIKLKSNSLIDDINVLKCYEYIPDEFLRDIYLVNTNMSTFETIQLVNSLSENSQIEFIEPNFMCLIKPNTADQFFPLQWAINNDFSDVSSMEVQDAWSISTGSGIKVAILDEGVQLDHPDLADNLLPGHDTTDLDLNGAPNLNNDDYHGTACAGIVAAVANNGIGIAGVAYDAKILPVRIAYHTDYPIRHPLRKWRTYSNWIANGINWAVANGADVLSNSYSMDEYSALVENAINNAVTNGRNGKGSIVLFSSGNDNYGNGNDVAFPARSSNAIAVGASSMCDKRIVYTNNCGLLNKWASNYGNTLDIVAPGERISTTDLTGANGASSEYDVISDYSHDFNGTSAACPNAAGVAALILSVNPNFTQAQVREILETTTDKIGDTPYNVAFQNYGGTQTWNNEVGYGRINADSAVQKALNYDNYNTHYITGPTQITPGTGGFYKISNQYTYATNYVWSIPSGCYSGYCWEIVQGQGTYQPIIHGGTLGVQNITCKIYNGSTLIGQQSITVNVQNPSSGGSGNPCEGLQTGPTKIYPPIPCDENGPNSVNQSNYFKRVYIYSVSGQVVLQLENAESVDISQLSSGLYFVKAELSNNTILTKKIVKK
jgi:subtilisin family serine protease